jgi:glycosyltransferase involved in cell wall biosynthesis
MKKVLVITYYWPPSGGAGVQRWLKFVKYLPNYNYKPVIYTVENGEYPVLDSSLSKDVSSKIKILKSKIWEPYSLYKIFTGRKKKEKINSSFLTQKKRNKFLQNISIWIRGNLFIPDARRFWIKPSINYLTNFLINNPVDIIISSGPPHSTHLIAMELQKRFQIKWLADFRDPWTNIDFYKDLKLTKWADNKHKALERAVLKNTDMVLTIGNQLKKELLALGSKEVEVVENGYDPEDFPINSSLELDTDFTIAHIGTFSPSRNHEILWKVLKKICNENEAFDNKLKIKLIGNIDFSVLKSISNFGLENHLKKLGYISHNDVINEQKKSRVLLLMVNNTPNSRGIITGKVFEYMASNRPILVIGPEDGDLANIIRQTNTGFVTGFDNEIKLEESILKLFKNKENFDSNLKMYSRENLTKKLSSILDKMISK